MVIGTKKRQLHVRLDTTARRWLKRNKFPHGVELVLERRDGRKVRGDTVIHRHDLPSALDAGQTVSAGLDALQATFITNIKARGQKFKLLGPDRAVIAGQTLVSSVRKLPGLPDKAAQAAAARQQAEIETVFDDVMKAADIDPDWGNSRENAARGIVRALLRLFDSDEAERAFAAERSII